MREKKNAEKRTRRKTLHCYCLIAIRSEYKVINIRWRLDAIAPIDKYNESEEKKSERLKPEINAVTSFERSRWFVA